jgi:hypothetical protein
LLLALGHSLKRRIKLFDNWCSYHILILQKPDTSRCSSIEFTSVNWLNFSFHNPLFSLSLLACQPRPLLFFSIYKNKLAQGESGRRERENAKNSFSTSAASGWWCRLYRLLDDLSVAEGSGETCRLAEFHINHRRLCHCLSPDTSAFIPYFCSHIVVVYTSVHYYYIFIFVIQGVNIEWETCLPFE